MEYATLGDKMKHLYIERKSIWVGWHQSLGILLYDISDQSGVDADHVRLYKVSEQTSALFQKSTVREKLLRFEFENVNEVLDKIREYVEYKRPKSGCTNCGLPLFLNIDATSAHEVEGSGLCSSCDAIEYELERRIHEDERERRNFEIEQEIKEENFYGRYGTPFKF